MKKILVVDDSRANLHVMYQILKDHYLLMFASDGKKAVQAAAAQLPDLILLDIMMPGISGFETCQHIKNNPLTQHIPIIFVTAMIDEENEAKGFDLGAVDYIHKPVSGPLLLRRVQLHLSLVRAKELEESQKAAIFMLGKAGHFNDTDTGIHIWRMSSYSRALAKLAGWSDECAERLELASSMHDTGKIGIPDSILKAPRKLTDAEWEIMKTHTQIGSDILSQSHTPIFTMAAEVALYHHEKWDGSGYPFGLKGRNIPESARIVAIADVFDALTTVRSYKMTWSVDEAADEIKRGWGTHFDPSLATLFLENLPIFFQIREEWDMKASLLDNEV